MPKPSWTGPGWTGLGLTGLGLTGLGWEGQSNRTDLIAPLNLLSSADLH